MMPARKFLRLPAEQATPQSEETFFTSVMVRNGTYKTTFPGRFADVDDAIIRLLDRRVISARNVLDVAVSSGTSTLDLAEKLRAHGRQAHITATDILLDVRIVRVFPRCYAMLDETGFPLRFDLLWWGIKPWVSRNDYFNGKAVFRKAIHHVFLRRAQRLLGSPKRADVESARLVSPRLIGNKDVHIEHDDLRVFNPDFARRFDFIRAANILNKGYFPPSDLQAMIGHLKRYLAGPGSSLLVLRTHADRSNHGALYRVDQQGDLERLTQFGEGSEVDELIASARITTS